MMGDFEIGLKTNTVSNPLIRRELFLSAEHEERLVSESVERECTTQHPVHPFEHSERAPRPDIVVVQVGRRQ